MVKNKTQNTWKKAKKIIPGGNMFLSKRPELFLPDVWPTYYKKAKLRAHSDLMWNTAVNEWAGTFRKDFDIMVEAKSKNLASIPFEESTN